MTARAGGLGRSSIPRSAAWSLPFKRRAEKPVLSAGRLQLNRLGQGGIVLVSADQELNAAAVAEGLGVADPTAHP